MAESLSDWLALREASDTRARSPRILESLIRALPAARPLRVLDLGSGTGSNIRFLSPRLPGPQEWTAVDRDPDLLAQRPDGVTSICRELGAIDDQALFAGRHLVTASALLDLVSASWISLLADQCCAAGSAVLFALNYDGRSVCTPREPEDDFIRELFNRHQRTNDKGFGTAAGPDAADCAVRAFASAGYHVESARSDWLLTPDAVDLQRELIMGWAYAAEEIASEHDRIAAWLTRRIAHIHEGRSYVQVGHHDVAAWPVR